MVSINNNLYFSPNFKFIDINWGDKNKLINAFQDRVKGFYLKPAEYLNKNEYAFAKGVICVTAIDFLARIEMGINNKVGERFENWLKLHIKEFNEVDPQNKSQTLAYRFYDEFRNGLVHEGRIKNAGQFSCEIKSFIQLERDVLTVNPKPLLNALNRSFEEYIIKVKKEEFAFQNLRCALVRDFQRDMEYVYR